MVLSVLLDTNVLLDYLLCRDPYAQDARDILAACRDGRIKGYMAAHSLPNMFYILRRTYSIEERRSILLSLCELLDVIDIDREKIIRALQDEGFQDFEDCLQKECAETIPTDYIVTRNLQDFRSSEIACLDPAAFCAILAAK